MKKTKKLIASLLTFLLLSSIIIPSALAMPKFGFLRQTPVSGAGIVREAFFFADNTLTFTNTAGVQLTLAIPSQNTAQITAINQVSIPGRSSRHIFSSRLTSTSSTDIFRDHGGW